MLEVTVGVPSGLGLPSTFMTSALVGFWPSALMTSPHWAYEIFISPLAVRSNSMKASLNSEDTQQNSQSVSSQLPDTKYIVSLNGV